MRRAVSGRSSYAKRSSGVTRRPSAWPTSRRRNPPARPRAATVSAGFGTAASDRTYTRATRRSALTRTALIAMSRSWALRASSTSRRPSAVWMRWATRACRRSATLASIMQELDALGAELGELEAVDELDDLPETCVHVGLIGADLADAERDPLPEVVVVALRDRHVEGVAHPRLDRPDHAALPLERVVLGEQQLETQHPDHHRWRGRPYAGRSAAWGPLGVWGVSRRATCSTSYASITSPTFTS